MLTELEQRANNEARHAHRELVEKLEANLQSMALDYLAAEGQAAEAYQAQLAAEAKLAKAMRHVMEYSNDPHLVRWAENGGDSQ
jgi:hypothetical protein